MSHDQHPTNAEDRKKGSSYHALMVQQTDGQILLWVGYQGIEPLLRDDISSGERLACQFAVATTLIHELIQQVILKPPYFCPLSRALRA